MKKLTALLLVLMLSFCLCSGCGETESFVDDEESVVLEEVDDEEEIEENVSEFMELYFAMNEEAFDFVDEDSDAYDDFEGTLDGEAMLGDTLVGRRLPKDYEDSKEIIADTFFNKYAGYLDLEIENIRVNEDSATVICAATVPDINELESIVTEEFVLEVFENNFTKKEIADIYSGKALESLELSFKMIRVLCEEVLSEMKDKTVEKEFTLTLEKQDGSWMIIDIE